MDRKMLAHASSLPSQCYTQGQVNLILVRNYTAQRYPLRQLNSSVSLQTHWPRTKGLPSVNEFHSQQCLLLRAGNQFEQRERSKTTLPVLASGCDLKGGSSTFQWVREAKILCEVQQFESRQRILLFVKHFLFYQNCGFESLSVFTCLPPVPHLALYYCCFSSNRLVWWF